MTDAKPKQPEPSPEPKPEPEPESKPKRSFWSKTKDSMKMNMSPRGGVNAEYMPTFKSAAHVIRGHNTAIFLVLAAFIHFALAARGYSVWSLTDPLFMLYIILALFATFLFYKDPGEGIMAALPRLGFFLMLTVLAYSYPFSLNWMVAHGWIDLNVASIALFVAPVWVVYILFNPGDSRITSFIATVVCIAWCIIIIVLLMQHGLLNVPTLFGNNVITVSSAKTGVVSIYNYVSGQTKAAVKEITTTVNEGIANATQESYTGTVDQAQGQDVGVFITNLKPALTKFYADNNDSVIVYATLSARTITDSINVTNACFLEFMSKDGTKLGHGSVYPGELNIDYTGAFQSQFDISCTVPHENYSSLITTGSTNSAMLAFNSTFNFVTFSYVPYAFMDRDLLVSLRRSNVDAAQKLGIMSTPISKFTPGPLMMGMASDTQPYSYYDGGPLPFFGLTLTNQWFGKGNVKNFSSVDVYIPKPFNLELDTCVPKDYSNGGSFSYDYVGDWDQNPAYNHYQILDVAIKPGQPFTTIRCQLGFTDDAAQLAKYPILGTSGAAVDTFFASANYTYTLEAKTAVTIVSPAAAMDGVPGGAGTGTGATYQPTSAQIQMENDCTAAQLCDSTNLCTCAIPFMGTAWNCKYTKGNVRARTCFNQDAAGQEKICWYSTTVPATCKNCAYQGDPYSCDS